MEWMEDGGILGANLGRLLESSAALITAVFWLFTLRTILIAPMLPSSACNGSLDLTAAPVRAVQIFRLPFSVQNFAIYQK